MWILIKNEEIDIWEFEPNAVRKHFVHVGHLFLQPLDHGNHLGKRFIIHILFCIHLKVKVKKSISIFYSAPT